MGQAGPKTGVPLYRLGLVSREKSAQSSESENTCKCTGINKNTIYICNARVGNFCIVISGGSIITAQTSRYDGSDSESLGFARCTHVHICPRCKIWDL